MTDHTNLIARLRLTMQQVNREAADALEALQGEVERLTGSELGLNRYLATVQAEHRKLRAEVEATRKANLDCMDNYNQLRQDYDLAQARLTALESDKEVLLGHMDTINRCSNDSAIFNLSKVVIERFAAGAAPSQYGSDELQALILAKLAAPTKEQT